MHADLEAQRGGHDGPHAHCHLAGRQRRPVVQREHGLAGEAFEQAVLHHGLGARAAFLGGLEDQVHRSIEIRLLRQQRGRAQQHGRVPVMAAGMHAARVLAGMAEGVDFRHRQRIHVGPYADAAARVGGAAPPAVDACHHAGPAQPAVHLQSQRHQVGRHLVAGAVLLVAQLGVGMQVVAELQQGAEVGGDVGCGSHTGAAAACTPGGSAGGRSNSMTRRT